MSQFNIDTELLIIEVESRRNLWHVGDEEYKDRDIRIKSWQEVATYLIDNFEDFLELIVQLSGKQRPQDFRLQASKLECHLAVSIN
jgi:hypothetical protein